MKRSRVRNFLVASAILIAAITTSASAHGMKCSIHPKKGTADSALPAMTRVSMADAEKTAVASLKVAPGSAVPKGELEVEHGCLIYSFDVSLTGKSGVEEVAVDAGTGKVLSRKHESALKEAAEKAGEKTEKKPPR